MNSTLIKSKGAWIRIVEAFIAITIVAGFFAFIYASRIEKPEGRDEIYKEQRAILELIARDTALRESVLEKNEDELKNFVKDKIAPSFDFEIKICELKEICSLQTLKKEVYSSEAVISSTLETYSPKKIKIFMWEKE